MWYKLVYCYCILNSVFFFNNNNCLHMCNRLVGLASLTPPAVSAAGFEPTGISHWSKLKLVSRWTLSLLSASDQLNESASCNYLPFHLWKGSSLQFSWIQLLVFKELLYIYFFLPFTLFFIAHPFSSKQPVVGGHSIQATQPQHHRFFSWWSHVDSKTTHAQRSDEKSEHYETQLWRTLKSIDISASRRGNFPHGHPDIQDGDSLKRSQMLAADHVTARNIP